MNSRDADPRLAVVSGATPRGLVVVLALLALAIASFVSLHVTIAPLFEPGAADLALDFVRGFAPPDVASRFVARLAVATLETLAMSAVGTLVAAAVGVLLAWPASRRDGAGLRRGAARTMLAVLRAVPELVWAALFVIVAGLGPFAGTMALALHTSGVLGRLFAETLENLPPGPADALRAAGVAGPRCSHMPRCRRRCRSSCRTRCTDGRTTSARPRCSGWSARAAWVRC